MSTFRLLSVLLLVACSGGETSDNPEKKEDNPPAKKTLQLDLNDLKGKAEKVMLVPSPSEMQKSLKKAKLSSNLSQMVPKERKSIAMNVENKDNLAVRTGVILADLVLTVESSTKEEKIERLEKLQAGLKKLETGDDIQLTIDEMKSKIKTGDLHNNDDLLQEFEELSGIMVPELEQEAGEWIVPLIQAGSWLEGANLVSTAIINEKKFDAASNLLRQPDVVAYFLSYVERKGRDKAPDKTVEKLIEVLKTLQTISAKNKLSEEDVKSIQKSTGEVLSML